MRYGLSVTRIATCPPRIIAWRSGQDHILHFVGDERAISLTQVNSLIRSLLRDDDGTKGIMADIRIDPDDTLVIQVDINPAKTPDHLLSHYLGNYEPLLLNEFIVHGSDG